MIAILASAKTLDFETPWQVPQPTLPEFLKKAQVLMNALGKLSAKQIGRLMAVSPKIAQLNAQRFQRLGVPHTPRNAKPALLAYQGDVYRSMQSRTLKPEELAFAQKSLRILSGLYGVLRPLDLIQPYRFEMAVALSGPSWRDLYDYWSEAVTQAIDRDAAANGKVIVNLASQEYAAVLNRQQLKSRLLHVVFKQERKGKTQLVPILAKRARGLMARYVVSKRVLKPEGMKAFATDGYRFSLAESSEQEWVFVRSA